MTGNKELNLLIVDDEPDVAELFESIVEDEYQCTVCTDPKAALTLLQERAFDIVVTDLKMPGVSGDHIVAAAKAKDAGTRVYISSGHSSDDGLVKEALEKGASGVITKPYTDLDEILTILKS